MSTSKNSKFNENNDSAEDAVVIGRIAAKF